jgi:hypothetical protein
MIPNAGSPTIEANEVHVFALSRRDAPGYSRTYKSPHVVKWSVAACTTLTDREMPPDLLGPARSWLLHCALTPKVRPATPAEEAASPWLVDHSLELTGIKAKDVEGTLIAMSRRLDDRGNVASTTLARRRNVLHHCMRMAEHDELLSRNPVSTVDSPALPSVKAVDSAVVPDLQQVEALIAYIDHEIVRPGARGDYLRAVHHHYATFLRVMLLSGMRPSEVSNLHVHHLHLPPTGWGMAKVWGGTVVAGSHRTDTGARYDDSGQKWRDCWAGTTLDVRNARIGVGSLQGRF